MRRLKIALALVAVIALTVAESMYVTYEHTMSAPPERTDGIWL